MNFVLVHVLRCNFILYELWPCFNFLLKQQIKLASMKPLLLNFSQKICKVQGYDILIVVDSSESFVAKNWKLSTVFGSVHKKA